MPTLPLDLEAVHAAFGTDPELQLQAQHLTTTIKVVIGETQSFLLSFVEGNLKEIDPIATPFDSFDIQLVGTEEHWSNLLAAVPPAFYQDFFPAMLYHGFKIEGDMETIMAYFPAIHRMQDLLRSVAQNEEVAV